MKLIFNQYVKAEFEKWTSRYLLLWLIIYMCIFEAFSAYVQNIFVWID